MRFTGTLSLPDGVLAHFDCGFDLPRRSDAIRGGADPLLGREDAVGQARAIELLYRAADEP